MANHPIIIAGHSHVSALIGGKEWVGVMHQESIAGADSEAGYPEDRPSLVPVDGYMNILGLRGEWPRNEAYWSALADQAPGNAIALLWEGNQHNSLFFVEQPIPFDFVPRALQHLPVEDGAWLVPESLVREKLQSAVGNLQELLENLKAAANCQVALVGTPPPPLIPAGHNGVRITASNVRLKLWYVLTEIMEEQAEVAGVAFIPIPGGVTDEAGFLKREFWMNDSTHANPAYGRIMLSHIAQMFDRD